MEIETIISFGLSLFALLYSIYKGSAANMKELENRITTNEQYRFTKEDRDCMNEMKLKVDLFWSVVEKEFPKILVRHETPEFDKLLNKASDGLDKLSLEELSRLSSTLKSQYKIAKEEENPGRAMAIALYKGVVEEFIREKNESNGDQKCQN